MALLAKDQAEQFLTAEKWAVVMEKITNPPTVKINIPSVEIFDILSREIPTMRISDLESADSLEADTVTDAPLEQLNEQPTEQPFDLTEEQFTEQPISPKDSSDGALDTLASLAGGLEGKKDLHTHYPYLENVHSKQSTTL